MYTIPTEYCFPIHHIKPRFKNDAESVLLFIASEISSIPEQDEQTFKEKLNRAIKRYPGNGSSSDKTIDNWRTEISSLFGFIEREGELRKAGRIARLLADHQDLVEFFRYFLYYFQYPGGHLKPHESLKLIEAGVKFKPAQYLIDVMLEGRKLLGDEKFGLTKAEATHLIFNDLRVTRDGRPAKDTAAKILANREAKVIYDNSGDIIRYAGDILDYMELADLTKIRYNGQYYPNMVNFEVLQAFLKSKAGFKPYDDLYGKNQLSISDVKDTTEEWFKYVNNKLESSIFTADIMSVIKEAGETTEALEQFEFIQEILGKLQQYDGTEAKPKTKEIGDVGEAIVIEHEKARLKIAERQDVLHLIKKIPEHFAMGYDISSYDGVGATRRYIEVKTTISRKKLQTYNFHMTTSEWSAAESTGDLYYIYRLLISSEKVSMFLIQNPVRKYKDDLLAMVPRNGAEITYNENSGKWEELLV